MNYVLVTAAQNEEALIEATIRSVIAQTIRPLRWLIISDGSTDRTDEIVLSQAARHDWIELMRMPPRGARDFGGKALCINAGAERLKSLPYDLIGSLDADITFAPDYFEFLLGKFADDATLGLAGTPFEEDGGVYDYRFSSTIQVSGACQVFRRTCFDEIGGYAVFKGGGIDSVAVLHARMKGWHTRTFVEKRCQHHRPMGTATNRHKFAALYRLGGEAYRLGYHPVWQVCRTLYQMTKPPYVVGGMALLCGYSRALLRREARPITREMVEFQRRDQLQRLRGFAVTRLVPPRRATEPVARRG